MSDVQTYLEDVRDLSCAPLLRLLVEQVSRLDPEVKVEVGAFGVRFRLADRLLCEFSVFGELFIARLGPMQAIEYRVRSREVAMQALDHVLRDYVELRGATPTLAAPAAPAAPLPPAAT